jgi:hypothetical protein
MENGQQQTCLYGFVLFMLLILIPTAGLMSGMTIERRTSYRYLNRKRDLYR